MAQDTRPVFFFDVDDCLYPQSIGVDALMDELINEFIIKRLQVSREVALDLNQRYYRQYGLTVIGLQYHHGIDPLEFNREVDGKLPLNKLLSRKEELIQFFASFDRSKVKLWLFTNAHIHHGLRVVELLGLTRYFEGITYCDYASPTWMCKPSIEMLEKAEREAGVCSSNECYYVDDNVRNCSAAVQRGWKVLWITADHTPRHTSESGFVKRIAGLEEIREIFPELLKRHNYQRYFPSAPYLAAQSVCV